MMFESIEGFAHIDTDTEDVIQRGEPIRLQLQKEEAGIYRTAAAGAVGVLPGLQKLRQLCNFSLTTEQKEGEGEEEEEESHYVRATSDLSSQDLPALYPSTALYPSAVQTGITPTGSDTPSALLPLPLPLPLPVDKDKDKDEDKDKDFVVPKPLAKKQKPFLAPKQKQTGAGVANRYPDTSTSSSTSTSSFTKPYLTQTQTQTQIQALLDRSPKLRALDCLLASLRQLSPEEKVVVVSNFTSTLSEVKRLSQLRGYVIVLSCLVRGLRILFICWGYVYVYV